MKKLLVLALVLTMASMSSAALKIAVNGVIDGTVTLQASETAVISIYTDAAIGFGSGDWAGVGLMAPTALATITGGAVSFTSEPGLSIQGTIEGAAMPPMTGQEGIGLTLSVTGANIPANTLLFDGFILHCEGSGPTVVSLWGTTQYVEWDGGQLAGVTITQIPEPMTMALLGLGGLFLRRRK